MTLVGFKYIFLVHGMQPTWLATPAVGVLTQALGCMRRTMRNILSALLASLGISSPIHADQPAELIDPKTVKFSMPTVAVDEIQYVVPTKESFQGAPQFHEDEWGQLEFFPKERLAEIRRVLKELHAFEKRNRLQYGWNDIFARKIDRSSVLPPHVSPLDVASLLSAQLKPAPILVTASRPLGQVKDGFTIGLGTNANLYGLSNPKGITVLGAHLAGADDMLLTTAFSQLNSRYGLILVDWRQQLVLVSVTSNGQIDVWKP